MYVGEMMGKSVSCGYYRYLYNENDSQDEWG